MDRLTSLNVFVQVVESGGFSAAARHLAMSTTMVSNHVQALEDRLGARLLNRTTRKVSLTEIGTAYHERCLQILSDLDEADSMAEALHSTPRGRLRLYTNTHIVPFIAPVVAEFLGRHPDVSVHLAMGEQTVDIVEEGYDLAIRTAPPPESSLIVRQLTPWSLILCCSPDYLTKHDIPKAVEDLMEHNCLRYAYYPFGDEWKFTDPAGQPCSVRVKGNLVSSSGETIRLMAQRGQGIALAPSFIIVDDLRSGRLVRLLEDFRPVEFVISAIYPHRHHLSAKVRSFIDLLAERFAEHRKWMSLATGA
jgi:DNA-binding transcriptional LysR family regulator